MKVMITNIITGKFSILLTIAVQRLELDYSNYVIRRKWKYILLASSDGTNAKWLRYLTIKLNLILKYAN